MKKEQIKISPGYSTVECPNCGSVKDLYLYPINIMEHIRKPELVLIECGNCKSLYQLMMKKFEPKEPNEGQ